MKWASYASDNDSLDQAVSECVDVIKDTTQAHMLDLIVVFASHHHQDMYEKITELIRENVSVRHIIGCSAGGVIGGGNEIELRAGLSLTAAVMPGVEINPFHADNDLLPDLDDSPDAWEALVTTSHESKPDFLVITDPFSIRSDNLLLGLDYAFGNSVKIGGMASGGQNPGSNALILNDQVYRTGAVGLALHGDISVDTIVAQGCRPIGQLLDITKCRQNILIELNGRPALHVLHELYESLDDKDRDLAHHSLFLGVEMNKFLEEPKLGDFLIRNIIGMDPRSGVMAIGEMLREGQAVQFHLRDAQASSEDLSSLMDQYAGSDRKAEIAGALLFSCLGRGIHLYGHSNHDTDIFRETFSHVPLGGFFCNGEIGPVQGTTYLHGYTSAFGLFMPKSK